jgi:hypothetical protein
MIYRVAWFLADVCITACGVLMLIVAIDGSATRATIPLAVLAALLGLLVGHAVRYLYRFYRYWSREEVS